MINDTRQKKCGIKVSPMRTRAKKMKIFSIQKFASMVQYTVNDNLKELPYFIGGLVYMPGVVMVKDCLFSHTDC